MPIYEYICEDCNEHFEKIVINKQQEIACPKCSSKKAAIQLSVFAAQVLAARPLHQEASPVAEAAAVAVAVVPATSRTGSRSRWGSERPCRV